MTNYQESKQSMTEKSDYTYSVLCQYSNPTKTVGRRSIREGMYNYPEEKKQHKREW